MKGTRQTKLHQHSGWHDDLVLLATIVGLALASMPILQVFGPDKVNTWVTYAPFVWLPGFLVQIAPAG